LHNTFYILIQQAHKTALSLLIKLEDSLLMYC